MSDTQYTPAQRVLGRLLATQDKELFEKLKERCGSVDDIPTADPVSRAVFGLLYTGGLCDLSIIDERSDGAYHDALVPLVTLAWNLAAGEQLFEEVDRAALIGVLSKAQGELASSGEAPSKVAESVRESLSKVSSTKPQLTWQEYLGGAERELTELIHGGVELTSGLRELDGMYSFRRKNVAVVAAPTSHGKTAFSLRMANRALDKSLKVAYWCFEDWSSIPYKLVSQRFKVPLEWYTKYHVATPEQRVKADSYLALAKTLPGMNVYPEMPLSQFRGAMKSLKPDLIVCDYIQRYVETYSGDSKREACGKLASDFDNLCKEFNAYGILCSQVRRRETMEGGRQRRPSLYDLKESGDIENYASSVLMLYWPWKDAQDKTRIDKADYIISVEKDKLGQCGETRILWDGSIQAHKDKYEL